MGEPILEAERVPVEISRMAEFRRALSELPPAGWIERCGVEGRARAVSMGNPHFVMYCGDVAAVPLETVGPAIESHPMFPRRINVHFVQVHSPGEVTMRTWERGSGITLACGTGASAVCVAGVLSSRTERKLLAHLPGGDLHLEWNAVDNHVYMTGPAVEVFSGDWP
jgi:diaminopimelate epimerase